MTRLRLLTFSVGFSFVAVIALALNVVPIHNTYQPSGAAGYEVKGSPFVYQRVEQPGGAADYWPKTLLANVAVGVAFATAAGLMTAWLAHHRRRGHANGIGFEVEPRAATENRSLASQRRDNRPLGRTGGPTYSAVGEPVVRPAAQRPQVMRRGLLTVCSAVFLLLWAASYGFPAGVRWTHPGGRFACFVNSAAGRLDLAVQTVGGAPAPRAAGATFAYEITEPGRVVALIRGMRADDAYVAAPGGRMCWRSARGSSAQVGSTLAVRLHVLAIPYWLPVLACVVAVLVAPAVRRKLARRRAARRLCAHCGYDLRASPGRCPECGAVPAPGGAAASPRACV